MRLIGLLTVVLFLNFLVVIEALKVSTELAKSLEQMPWKVYVVNKDGINALMQLNKNKRAIPMSGGIYGKRSAPSSMEEEESYAFADQQPKRAALPFNGGIYGKRSVLPYNGGIYGKRAVLPYNGGIYGKRAALPFNGGIYGKRTVALRSLPISGGIYG